MTYEQKEIWREALTKLRLLAVKLKMEKKLNYASILEARLDNGLDGITTLIDCYSAMQAANPISGKVASDLAYLTTDEEWFTVPKSHLVKTKVWGSANKLVKMGYLTKRESKDQDGFYDFKRNIGPSLY